MPTSKTDELFKGMSVQTVSLIVTFVIEMVMFSFWSRHLSKLEFGYLAAINGVLTLIGCISQAGLGSAIVQKKNASPEFVSTAFTLSLILGIGGTLIVFIFSPQIAQMVAADSYLTTPLQIMSATLLLNTLLSVSRSQLIKQLRFTRNAVITISSYIIGSIVGIFLAFHGWGLYALISASIVTLILNIVIIYSTSLKVPKLGINRKYVSGIASYGGWLTLGSIIVTFAHKADSLLLSRLLSVKALGAYNRPAGFVSSISTQINSIFDSVLFPLLSEIQDDKTKVKDVLLRAISILNSCSIVLAAIFFFHAELIITIFFGKEWIELVPIMRVISIIVIFRIDGRLVDCFFRSLNLVRLGAILRFVEAVIMIVGIVIGARYGILGVAIALTLCEIVVILLKIFSLTISIKLSIITVVRRWFFSWRSIIPLLFISIPYMLIPHTLLINIIYAFIFAFVIILEFLIFPRMVGKEYADIAGQQIIKIKNKLKKR